MYYNKKIYWHLLRIFMSKEDNPKNDTNISPYGEKVRYLPFHEPPAHPDDDTIDLVELFQTLWKRRKLIIIITLLSLLGAGAYLTWDLYKP